MKLEHGGDIVSFQNKYPGTPVLDFSASINPLGMPRGVWKTLASCREACARYPDPLCRELTQAISRFEGVPAKWILCGNGASDLIWRVAWTLKPRRVLLPAPTFSEYERSLRAAGCGITHHPLRREDNFRLTGAILDQIRDCGLIFLCNPNNPTGLLADPVLLERILNRCREMGTILVTDECFLGFVADGERYSMKRYLAEYRNLLILRAFTKLFAMPGLRLGYLLCSDGELLSRLARNAPPWSVSAAAQACGVAAVREGEYLAETERRVPVWRAALADGLTELGCRVYPPAANYVFFEAWPGVAEVLKPRGILLRNCSSFTGLKEGYYRAAVRTGEENAKLLGVMREVLE